MKNKALIFLLTLCFLFAPLSAFAAQADVLSETVAALPAPDDKLYPLGEIAGEPILASAYRPEEQETPGDLPQIGCRAAYVADPVSGKVFFEKNAHQKMYPASTTKLLTALLVLENCELDELAVVSQRALSLVPDGYVRANLQAGEKLTVRSLLGALLIPSANDAAFVLAEHVAGSVEAFAAQSNQRAKELGCEMVHFVNPNGIHSSDHYCTAYDLYLIAKACQQYDVFNTIVTSPSFSLPATNAYGRTDRTFQNTNKLLDTASAYYYAGCTGIKTGHTDEAGECLVSGCFSENINLLSVVLGGKIRGSANDRFADTVQLFDFVYDHYAFKLIADKREQLREICIDNATKDTAMLDVRIGTDISCVAPNKITPENVDTRISLPENLKAPIQQNQVLGTVSYRVDGLIYATNLIAGHAVEKKPYWLYNLLVFLGAVLLVFLLWLLVKKREKEKRRQELLRRRRMQQLRQRRQAQEQNRNRQNPGFHS